MDEIKFRLKLISYLLAAILGVLMAIAAAHADDSGPWSVKEAIQKDCELIDPGCLNAAKKYPPGATFFCDPMQRECKDKKTYRAKGNLISFRFDDKGDAEDFVYAMNRAHEERKIKEDTQCYECTSTLGNCHKVPGVFNPQPIYELTNFDYMPPLWPKDYPKELQNEIPTKAHECMSCDNWGPCPGDEPCPH